MRRITTIFDGQFLPVNVLQDPNSSWCFHHRKNEAVWCQCHFQLNNIRDDHLRWALEVCHTRWLVQWFSSCRIEPDFPYRYWDDKPRWSPDGKTIYFVSNRTGFFNVVDSDHKYLRSYEFDTGKTECHANLSYSCLTLHAKYVWQTALPLWVAMKTSFQFDRSLEDLRNTIHWKKALYQATNVPWVASDEQAGNGTNLYFSITREDWANG